MPRNRLIVRSLFVFLLGFGMVFSSACTQKEDKVNRYRENAKQYIERREWKKAIIELRNIVQLDPEDEGAQEELGHAYMKLGQVKESFQSFSRAVSINPDNLEAQLKLGQIFLMAKKYKDAKEKAQLIMKKAPDDVEALTLLAMVQVQEEEVDAALETLEKASSINPNNFTTNILLGDVYSSKANPLQAEKTFRKASQLDPSAHEPYKALAGIYGSKGDWEGAEAELKRMVQASDQKSESLAVLARFYESRQAWDRAEKAYLEATKAAPAGSTVAFIDLGAFYAGQGSYEKALQAFMQAADTKKGDLEIQALIAQLHLDFKEIEQAKAVADKILAMDGSHVRANLVRGKIDLLESNFDQALDRFALVVKEDPKNSSAHYFRAVCLLKKGEESRARQALFTALDINPMFLDARLILTKIFLRKGELTLARQQIRQVLEREPENQEGLTLDGALKIQEKDMIGAEAVYKKLIARYPNFAPGYVQLGSLYRTIKKESEAVESLKAALAINPKQINALVLLVDIYVVKRDYQTALEICRMYEEAWKDSPSHSAHLLYLKGRIHLSAGQREKAKPLFERAIEIYPEGLASYAALAEISIQEKKIPEAISKYETIISKNPNFLQGYMMLGVLAERHGEKEKAEAYYRKALEMKEDFAPAANNLAWNLATREVKIDEALKLAQLAKEKMPDNPNVMDTLGWIYYLKGSYMQAIAELTDSLPENPNNPVIHYHLGKAYYKTEQYEKARQYMNEALDINPTFEWADDARRFVNK